MAKKSEVETEIVENSEIVTPEVETIEETAAADSLKPHSAPEGSANKAAGLAKVVDAFAKFGPETINKFLASLDQIGKEAEKIPSGAAAKNKASIETHKEEVVLDDAIKAVIKEDIDALFEGEDVKEDFKAKVSVLFESAINLKSAKAILELEEAYEAKFEEEVETIAVNLAETLNAYLDHSVTKWIEHNEVAIESSIRNDLTENFMSDLHTLFKSHYINVPADKDDLLEELTARIDELEAKASEQIDENVALKLAHEEEIKAANAKLEEAAVNAAFILATKDLTESDVEKLKGLSESVEYTSVDEFSNKINILKENYFSTKESSAKPDVLFEEVDKIEEEVQKAPKLQGNMSHYVSAISHTVRN